MKTGVAVPLLLRDPIGINPLLPTMGEKRVELDTE